MTDDELDMEDIESRLYSQVYHASVENEHNSNENIEPATRVSLQSTPYTLSNVPTRSNRYFHKEHVNHPIQSSYISFDDLTALQNNISFSPNSTDITTEGNFGSQFQNNITVNQYTLPVIINPEFSEVLNPSFGGKFFTSWAVKNQRLLSKKKQSKRVEIRKERKRQKKLENRVNNLLIEMHGSGDAQRKVNDVIYVSDDSDECIIQDKDVTSSVESQNVFTGFPKKI
ncbi:hypothetical protein NQ314_015332 [Rhamnusium bicolor]|uniref:Uncharacterized protein n=1 Tax=Rhamnusium bicolor TaxID=1586634 RepID=A0AAV8WYX4_9CUCU|nr:hypothetical protein NQ314_015332 [Rhamnusium bicolor]